MKNLLAILLLIPSFLAAQKNYTSDFDRYLEAQLTVNEFSGTVLVAHKGQVIYKKAFGLANREWNVPNTVETKFRIGSLTKQFTAAAILQLVHQGKLKLEDPLSRFFPGFPRADSVTIHMLLNHTSGIKSYTSIPNFPSISTLAYVKDSVVALIRQFPYDFSPGTKYQYNNSGYFLLGYIIEKVSGQSYSSYLDEQVISKAGLRNTAYNKLDSILPNRAMGYNRTPTGWKNAQYISMEFPYSAGALFSTVEDQFQWTTALFGGKIVPKELFIKMTTPYLGNYGYGLHIDSLQDHRGIGHSGGIPGFISYSILYPSNELYIVVLSNNGSNANGISKALAATFFNIPVVLPYVSRETKVDPAIYKRYEGAYQLNASSSVETIFEKDGKLYLKRRANTRELELKPESETRFFISNIPDLKVQFDVNNGMVQKTYFIIGGLKYEMTRLQRPI